MRIIIYTGKGGVGKTSIAAATALRASELGHRTLVMSTDAAHSLSDSLGVSLSSKITKVAKGLDGIEVDVLHELEHRWKEIQAYLTTFLVSQGLDELSAKEMVVFPGMELLSALFYVEELAKEKRYDVVIVDTAPTADTLRLLSFPEVADWYFTRLFGLFRNVIRVARATVGRVMKTPLPSDEVLEKIAELQRRLKAIHELLLNPKITSVRLVVNPEKMVITETQRAFTYLCLYGYTVESLIVNRVIPPDAGDGYFAAKLEEQKEYLEMIDSIFSPVPTLRAPLFSTEVLGKESLRELARLLFANRDPTQVFSSEKPMEIYQDERGDHIIALKLPYLLDRKVDLYTKKDVLIVQLGSYKRLIALPYSLADAEPHGAEFHGEWLQIRFRGEEAEGDAGRPKRRKAPSRRPRHRAAA